MRKSIEIISATVGIISFFYAILTFILPDIPHQVRNFIGVRYYVALTNCYKIGEFKDRGTFKIPIQKSRQSYEEYIGKLLRFDLADGHLRYEKELKQNNIVRTAIANDEFHIKEIIPDDCKDENDAFIGIKLLAKGVYHPR